MMSGFLIAGWVFAGLFLLHFGNAYAVRKQVRRALSLPLAQWRHRSLKVQALQQQAPRVTMQMAAALVLGVAFAVACIAGKAPSAWITAIAGGIWVRMSVILGRASRLAKLLPESLGAEPDPQ